MNFDYATALANSNRNVRAQWGNVGHSTQDEGAEKSVERAFADITPRTLVKPIMPEVEPVVVVETPAELAEGEIMLADTRDDNIIVEDPEMGLAEVIMISQDVARNVWVTIRNTEGQVSYYNETKITNRWGMDAAIEVAGAQDRAFVKGLRRAHNLIAA